MTNETEKLTCNVDSELLERFRELAGKKYKFKRGALTNAVTEALEDWIKKQEQ